VQFDAGLARGHAECLALLDVLIAHGHEAAQGLNGLRSPTASRDQVPTWSISSRSELPRRSNVRGLTIRNQQRAD
jgi:hypothetical protein